MDVPAISRYPDAWDRPLVFPPGNVEGTMPDDREVAYGDRECDKGPDRGDWVWGECTGMGGN